MTLERELATALAAARSAGELIRKEYESFVAIPDAPVTISTHADRASQDLIIAALVAAFPNDAICAEEATQSLRDSKQSAKRVWVIDPIDGTRGFAMKNGEFSVMIGLTVDRVPVVGGDENYRGRILQRAKMPCEFDAAHARHLNVQ